MKKIVNDKAKYKTRATLRNRDKPPETRTGNELKYREVFLVDGNGYFIWKPNQNAKKNITNQFT